MVNMLKELRRIADTLEEMNESLHLIAHALHSDDKRRGGLLPLALRALGYEG